MPEITLAAETSREIGTRTSRRLRASGTVPGVLYGHGVDPLPVAIEGRALRQALSGVAGLNAVLTLKMEGRTQLAVAKAIQRDPRRNKVIHVDFLAVSADEVISVEVPIVLVGEADEVRKADGVISQELHNLTIHSTPGNIPNEIEIDQANLRVGDTIRVGDLPLPTGVTTDVDVELAVVTVMGPQAVDLGEEAEGEAAEGEGAEASGATEGDSSGGDSGGEPGDAPQG